MRNFQLKFLRSIWLILFSAVCCGVSGCSINASEGVEPTDKIVQKVNRCTSQASKEVSKEIPWYQSGIEFDRRAFIEEMYGADNPHKACVDELVERYLSIWMKTCSKLSCGDEVGGGCAHLSGIREGGPVYAALAHCKLTHQ